MTEAAKTEDRLPDDIGLAVFTRERAGGMVTAELEPARIDPAFGDRPEIEHPALIVRFRRPSPVDLAQIEARSRVQIMDLMKGVTARNRYGLEGEALTDEAVVSAMAPLVTGIEGAFLLWTDWNLGEVGPDGKAVKVPLTVERIAELFRGRPRVRTAWNVHLDAASPMDRAEGNVYAASPDTTTDAAATTAGDAPAEAHPAPGASAADPEPSAPVST